MIPGSYVEEAIEAKYENGYLYVSLPKSKLEHRIPVRTGAADPKVKGMS
jgi:HSP20 family molecular chaperone IbpA